MEGRERVGGWATADGWTWDDTSGWFGECGRGGGVETSDSPDEPAVDADRRAVDSDSERTTASWAPARSKQLLI